jgi:uncharacterized protein (DUF1697 family)
MDRLRSLFEELDLSDVSTVIASGNVIFSDESDDVEALTGRIERHLAQELGYDVATFLRSPAQLAAIAALNPSETEVPAPSDSSHYVMFLRAAAPDSLRSELAGLDSEMDEFHFSEAEVHWRIRGKLTDSPLFGGGLDRVIRAIPTTMRNMNTLRRIVAKTNAIPASRRQNTSQRPGASG